MEEGVYYFIAHNIVSIGMLLRHGLERRLFDEDYKEARKEYCRQTRLYRSGEIAYRPDFNEIYEIIKYRNKK